MKLEPDERSILAFFALEPQATKALQSLKESGFTEVQLDRVGRFGFRPDADERRPAISGKETSLVNAVLNPGRLDDESRVLLGATTEASGMSAPDNGDDYPFLVSVLTSQQRADAAVSLLKKLGARV